MLKKRKESKCLQCKLRPLLYSRTLIFHSTQTVQVVLIAGRTEITTNVFFWNRGEGRVGKDVSLQYFEK